MKRQWISFLRTVALSATGALALVAMVAACSQPTGSGSGEPIGVVTTVAGSAGTAGSTDGTGTSARFSLPYGIATDGTNLYVADTLNHTIRQVVIATGEVTTLAGTAGSSGSTDGTGAAALFDRPRGITIDGTNLYVTDTANHTIRQVEMAGGGIQVITLAGTATTPGNTDDTGSAARFNNPYGITTDGTNLYVADSGNHTIRKVTFGGEVTTLAGSAGTAGSTDGTGSAAFFTTPYGITTDGSNLYVADSGNHTVRRVVIANAEVTTVAGSAGTAGSADGTGSAARFSSPYGIAIDGTNLYVADSSNHTVRQVAIATVEVTTLAGSAGTAGSDDGTGAAARFNYPQGLTTDGTNLYVADSSNHTVRAVTR